MEGENSVELAKLLADTNMVLQKIFRSSGLELIRM